VGGLRLFPLLLIDLSHPLREGKSSVFITDYKVDELISIQITADQLPTYTGLIVD
jgi:hypothetical protein